MRPTTGPIETVIHQYIEGYLSAESALISKAFHPDTRLYSTDQGLLEKTEMLDWLSNLDARKEKQDLRHASAQIQTIDVCGHAATAKLTLTFEKYKFTDYLSLLQIQGQWKIIGKIYQMEILV